MNNAQRIELIVSKLNRKIIELDYDDYTEVTMRIDEIVPFLKDIYAIAVDDMKSRKFDLSQTIAHGTIAYEVDGESVSTGANVLTYGDQLKITATASEHYNVASVKVNGVVIENGGTINVRDDIAVVVETIGDAYDLTETISNGTITYTVGGKTISAGTDAIHYGETLGILAVPNEGYQVNSMTVNGNSFVNGGTITVSGDVAVVATLGYKQLVEDQHYSIINFVTSATPNFNYQYIGGEIVLATFTLTGHSDIKLKLKDLTSTQEGLYQVEINGAVVYSSIAYSTYTQGWQDTLTSGTYAFDSSYVASSLNTAVTDWNGTWAYATPDSN